MPLTKSVSKNMHELMMDNKKSGKSKGANGVPRSHKQMVAIALSATSKRMKNYHKSKGVI